MNDERFQIENGVLVRYFGEDEEMVIVPDNVTAIGDKAFFRCETITEVTLPEGVRTIGERAFMGCGWLTEIVLPDSLEMIGIGAFRGCDALEEIALPGSVREVPNACFYDCMNLKSVKLPDGLQRICARGFWGCSHIETIQLPDGLTEIEELAFEYCARLQTINLPDSLMSIGRHAFGRCRMLSDLHIPENVRKIGSNAFYETPFLARSDNGFVIGGDGILISCNSKEEHIVVPMGIRQIGEMAFAYNKSIRSVVLPEGVYEICNNAFERCTALSQVSLPESLRVIGDRAFEECSSLTGICLPDGLIEIGSGVFGFTPVADCEETLIPGGKYLMQYRGDEVHPKIPDTVTVLASGAFASRHEIRSVTLHGNIRSVCREAFRWCSNLEEVTIGANVQYLGEFAFAGCEKLHAYMQCGHRIVCENAFEAGQWLIFTEDDSSFTVQLRNALTPGSYEQALFDFTSEHTDLHFMQMCIPEYCLPVSICYANSGGVYADYLREHIVAAVCMTVDRADNALLRHVLGYGFLTEQQAIECAAYAIEHKALEQQVIIMRYKQDTFGAVSDETLDSRFDW